MPNWTGAAHLTRVSTQAGISYDPGATEKEYALVFNRMSASAYLRDHGQTIFCTRNYLAHLERLGTRVVNGRAAFAVEISKALQLGLLASFVPIGDTHTCTRDRGQCRSHTRC